MLFKKLVTRCISFLEACVSTRHYQIKFYGFSKHTTVRLPTQKAYSAATTVPPPSDRYFKTLFEGGLIVHSQFVKLVRDTARVCVRVSIFENVLS